MFIFINCFSLCQISSIIFCLVLPLASSSRSFDRSCPVQHHRPFLASFGITSPFIRQNRFKILRLASRPFTKQPLHKRSLAST
ncbi:hypothetical protein BKA64DRAFT_404786 [Cadophora sp. MPI-SDFR-AT-0126]|nr:hypothetical protein BKA64DRAFT_404786 [Leotiomycetes sp. MPI-SDFR-AT-0126]